MFKAEVHYHKWLSPGTRRIDAIINVSGDFDSTAPGAPGDQAISLGGDENLFEIFIIDNSGSMQGARIAEARNAACAAIELLQPQQRFAVIAGNTTPRQVVRPSLATPKNKSNAYHLINQIATEGDTHMETWLSLAADLFSGAPKAVRHALLLTDGGHNGGNMEHVLNRGKGLFRCDCRGVGEGWNVEQLKYISGRLGGNVDIIRTPEEMRRSFTELVQEAGSRKVSNMGLRISVPVGAQILSCKQVYPNIQDLHGRQIDPQTQEFATGAWGKEEREFHVAIEVKTAGQVLEDMRFAKVSLHSPSLTGTDQPLPSFPPPAAGKPPAASFGITGTWTADDSKSALVNKRVAHYTKQGEAAECTELGIKAWENLDFGTATKKLGRAVQLYHQTGNSEGTKRLARLVEIDDAESGTVRLRSKYDKADAMEADCRSTRTDRMKKE